MIANWLRERKREATRLKHWHCLYSSRKPSLPDGSWGAGESLENDTPPFDNATFVEHEHVNGSLAHRHISSSNEPKVRPPLQRRSIWQA